MLPPSVFTSSIISSLSCVSIFIGFFHMLKCLSHHFFLSLSLPSTKAKEASKQTKHFSTDTWSSFSYHPKEKICFLSLFPHLFTPGSIQLGFDYLPYTESFFFHQVYVLIFKSSENFLVFLLPNTLGYSTLTPHIFNPKSTVLWFTGFFCGLFFLCLCLACTVSLCPWHLFSSKSSFSLDNFIHAQGSICHISVGSSKNLHLYSNLSSDFKDHYPIRVFPKIPQTQNFCNRIHLVLAHNVPVFNLLLLSSRSTLHCLLCDHKVGPCKHLSFASCLDVKLCQNRVLKCPTAGRSVSFIAPSLWEPPSTSPWAAFLNHPGVAF